MYTPFTFGGYMFYPHVYVAGELNKKRFLNYNDWGETFFPASKRSLKQIISSP